MQLLAQCQQETEAEFLVKRKQQMENVMQSFSFIEKVKVHSVRARWYQMEQKRTTHMCEFSFLAKEKNLYLKIEIEGEKQTLKCEFARLETPLEERQWRSFCNNEWICLYEK
jgi:hypothetical protein